MNTLKTRYFPNCNFLLNSKNRNKYIVCVENAKYCAISQFVTTATSKLFLKNFSISE